MPLSSLPMGSETRVPFMPNARYPDPAIEVLDDRFLALRLFSASVEQLATGLRWGECSGTTSVFRQPSNHANGHARDRQGRLLSCEHLTRCITRTEHDGAITVLADRYNGRRFNSPNDIVCARNGGIWFSDPSFGIHGWWEGEPAASELSQTFYRLDPATGALQQHGSDLVAPNALAFSPDESVLYVIESRATPNRLILAASHSLYALFVNVQGCD